VHGTQSVMISHASSATKADQLLFPAKKKEPMLI